MEKADRHQTAKIYEQGPHHHAVQVSAAELPHISVQFHHVTAARTPAHKAQAPQSLSAVPFTPVLLLTFMLPMSQYCALQASRWHHIYVPTNLGTKLEAFYFILRKKKKETNTAELVPKIRKLQLFKDSDCMFGPRVRKTAGTRSCCSPKSLW